MSKKTGKNSGTKQNKAAKDSQSAKVSARGSAGAAVAPKQPSSKASAAKANQRGTSAPALAPEALAASVKGASAPTARDPRLPPVGTVLVKRDRDGGARCECKVEEAGFRYRDTLHRSLSAAASAAAIDLGIKGRVNGFVFWGIVKAPRPAVNPTDYLRKMATRYTERATEFLRAANSPGVRTAVRRELEAHAAQLSEIVARSAA